MLSIVVPVYNESCRVRNALERLSAFSISSDKVLEIIFVDDGSKDDTAAIIRDFMSSPILSKPIVLMQHEVNKGKGAAVRTGITKSRGDMVLFTDVDLSTPPEEALRMLSLFEDADIVIGSRYMHESIVSIPSPFVRRCMSRVYNFSRKIILGQKVHDSQCGFKMFSRKAAEIVFSEQTIPGLAFDTEIIAIAMKNNLKIRELGVHWAYNNHGNLKPFAASIHMLGELLKIRFNLFCGIYGNKTMLKK
jgi:dolichyl-phosphate beta-glucosyltransferase